MDHLLRTARSIQRTSPTRRLPPARLWGPMQRHVPDSIATVRFRLARPRLYGLSVSMLRGYEA